MAVTLVRPTGIPPQIGKIVTETSLPSSEPASYAKHRFLLLDGMRGLAAIGVLSFHVVVDTYYDQLDSLYLLVDFFFVLSGFVLWPSMPAQAVKLGRQSGVFILKRIFRFWPLTIAALVLSLVSINVQRQLNLSHGSFELPYGSFVGMKQGDITATLVGAFLLLQILISSAISLNAPLWSLSAEWLTNVLYAPLTAVKWGLGIIALIAVGYAMLAYGLHTDQAWIKQAGPIRGWEALGRAMLGFGMGLMLRRYLPALSKFRNIWLLLISVGMLVILNRLPHDIGYQSCYVAAPIFALFILQLTKFTVKPSTRLGKVLAFLGAYSFGIYAFHFPLTQLYPAVFGKLDAFALKDVVIARFLTESTAVTFVAILLTFITHVALEKPLQKWGKHLVERAAAPLAGVPSARQM
jgi:peptidoglycan/LPS O-acetylase OafA/YrhL